MKGTPLLIFANKQDLVQALPPDEVQKLNIFEIFFFLKFAIFQDFQRSQFN